MPIVTVKLAAPMPDNEKCEEIIADLTKYFESKLGKKRERVVVMLEEIKQSHIGFGGISVRGLNNNELIKNYTLDDR